MPGLTDLCRLCCGGLLLLVTVPVVAAGDGVLTVGHIAPDASDERRDAYFLELLEAALEVSSERYGAFELKQAPVQMTQSRAMREMRRGRYVDVIWTMTDRSREEELLPVRIPLLRGLLGVRVPVVASGGGDAWEAVDSLKTLRAFVAGQSHDWPDTRILVANGIRVETSSHYEGLFRMLARNRVDYVPRAVPEVWAEAAIYQRHDLEVLEGPLIVYPAPIYYFVSPDNQALAERLEYGLQSLIRSGAFLALFESHPSNRQALERFMGEEIRKIHLRNPDLTPETPLGDPSLWVEGLFSID